MNEIWKGVLENKFLFCYNLNIELWLGYCSNKAIVLLENNDIIRYHE